MDPNDLPRWLLGIQAVTWDATGDAALTAPARPNAAAPKLRGHPYAIPVEGCKSYWKRTKDLRHGIIRQYLEYTGARPRGMRKEPLSAAQRAGLAGEISEWAGGFSLTNLAIRTGRWPQPHIQRLVEAARSGRVRTIDRAGNVIGPEIWAHHTLREAFRREGVLVMVPDPYVTMDEDTAVEPLFHRDDVLKLKRSGHPSAGSAQMKAESRGEALHRRICEWHKGAYPNGTSKPWDQRVEECRVALGRKSLSPRTVRRAFGGK
jgi:hypothetical protein